MATNFDDGKEAGALRTIGEVCQALGIKAHVLRYWEQQFPTLKPLKRSGGRRYYRPEDIATVERIDQLVNVEGYTLKGAKAALRQGKGAAADSEGSAKVASAKVETAPHLIIGAQADGTGGAGSGGPSGEASDAAPDLLELLPKLKAVRSRLAQALDA
ncbi:MAG: MerR family transcriptional regulator [Erythrobacter sp.]